MPQVIPLVVAVGLKAIGASVLVSTIAIAAASVGASLLSKKSSSPATASKINIETIERLNASIDPRTPRKTIIGTTAMATDIRDQEYSADQAYLHRFIVVASHKVHAIREIWFDDVKAWTLAGGAQGKFAGYLDVTPVLEGNAGNAINISARIGSARRFTGCAYVHIRYKLSGNTSSTDSPFAQSIPSRITIIGDGAYLYDPRRDSTVPGGSGPQRIDDQSTWEWSDDACRNPPLALLFYLIGWRINGKLAIGCGIPPSRLLLQTFITAANMCDEPVTRAVGGAEPRYRCDGIWGEGTDRRAVIDAIKATMNAEFDDFGGGLGVTILHNDLATPVATFTADDVIDAGEWNPTIGLEECFNIVRGTFTDASDNSLYQQPDYPQVELASVDGIDRIDTFPLPMVESPSQAQRLAKTRLQRQQYGGTIPLTLQITGWRVQKNDPVRFTFPALGWVNKLFRVAEIEYRMDGTVPVTLRVEHADIYAWDSDESPAVVAAAPTTYDQGLNPIIQSIDSAATTADWPFVGDSEGTKPEDNATVGAPVGTSVAGRTAEDVLEDIDVNTSAIISQALRQDDLDIIFDARTLVEGQPVSTTFLNFRNDYTDDTSAIASTFSLIGAKNAGGTAFDLNLDTVRVSPTETLGERLTEVSAETAANRADVVFLQSAVIDATGPFAKAVLRVDVNGHIAGVALTADAEETNISFIADNFQFVTSAGGSPINILTYNGTLNRWEFSIDVYAKRLVADVVEAGNLKQSAVQQTNYQIIPADVNIAASATANVATVTFTKQEASSTLKVQFFGKFWSADDLQFNSAFVLDGTTSYDAGQINVILVAANARMPMTPFYYLEGLSVGVHTIDFAVTNVEADSVTLSVKAGSVLEVVELKRGAM